MCGCANSGYRRSVLHKPRPRTTIRRDVESGSRHHPIIALNVPVRGFPNLFTVTRLKSSCETTIRTCQWSNLITTPSLLRWWPLPEEVSSCRCVFCAIAWMSIVAPSRPPRPCSVVSQMRLENRNESMPKSKNNFGEISEMPGENSNCSFSVSNPCVPVTHLFTFIVRLICRPLVTSNIIENCKYLSKHIFYTAYFTILSLFTNYISEFVDALVRNLLAFLIVEL